MSANGPVQQLAEFVGTPLTGRSRSVANHDDPAKAAAGRYKQEVKSGLVTDGRGGQRFHGAFHGGFSAGYFNTVGSIHGFTPAAFKSSRKAGRSGAVGQQQRPEDFMDEEDLEEHMQLGVHIRNQSVFRTTADELAGRQAEEIAPGLVASATVVRSIGIMLMQRMGWRRADPIGKPRAELRQYTAEPDPSLQQSRSAPKADVFGLGYIPSQDEQLHRLRSAPDEDAEDQYDTSIGFDDDDHDTIVPPRRQSANGVQERFPGYVVALLDDDLSVVSPPSIERLRIPSGWRPSSCPVAEAQQLAPELERFRPDIEQVAQRRRRPLSLDERSAALGEQVPNKTPQPKSIFEMISSDAKAQLSASLANMFHVGTTMVVGRPDDDVPVHFPDDPAKQARFGQFLKAKRAGADPASQPTRDWRGAVELQQFETLASTLPVAAAVKSEAKVDSRPELPTDYDSAARLKMFGTLTRETMDWVPPRLLCKRFHVPDPYQGRAIPTPSVQKRTRFEDLLATVHPELVALQNPVAPAQQTGVAKQDDDHDDDDDEPVVKEERPPVDLFKAIFADSDEDVEEESDEPSRTYEVAAEPLQKRPRLTV